MERDKTPTLEPSGPVETVTGNVPPAQATPFDYTGFGENVVPELRAAADRIRAAATKHRHAEGDATRAVFEAGRELRRVKGEVVPRGMWVKWLEGEFKDETDFTPRCAQRWMKAAKAFGEKCDLVSYLPVRTIYQLAAAPETTRNKMISKLEHGEKLSRSGVETMLRKPRHILQREASSSVTKAELEDKVAELEARVAQLEAENAGLKQQLETPHAAE